MRTVRISRHWDIEVPAVYGDTDETLLAKAEITDQPGNETRNLLHEAEGEITDGSND